MFNQEMVDLMVFDGLFEIFYGYHMGLTAENIAEKYGISRRDQDELGLLSHQRASETGRPPVCSESLLLDRVLTRCGAAPAPPCAATAACPPARCLSFCAVTCCAADLSARPSCRTNTDTHFLRRPTEKSDTRPAAESPPCITLSSVRSRRVIGVLIADDSAPLRGRLREMLGHRPGIKVVAEAEDAEGTVTAIRMVEPQAVILDLRMPGGGGFKVLEMLRGADPRPKVIVLTNFVDPPFRKKCLAGGADHFLDKSAEFDQVATLLEDLSHQQLPGS